MTALDHLPDHLRAWGLDVVEVPGWQDRRRPGLFNPVGILVHHTAGPKGKDAPSLRVCSDGRADLPGPLCQLLVARSGKVYVISSNRCNHAGAGGPLGGVIGVDAGNAQLVGIEAENDGLGETWPPVQLDAMVRASAAVLDLIDRPRSHCWAHREYTPRKPDPRGIDMTQFRGRVVAVAPPKGDTVPTPITDRQSAQEAAQRAVNGWLIPVDQLEPDGDWGPASTTALVKVLKGAETQIKGLTKQLDEANTAGASALSELAAARHSIDTNAATITRLAGERDTARANREAAEAEVAMLRKQLQEGGRLPALLAAIDMASTDIGRAWDDLNEAVAKARA